jgi:hypothetical protein
MEVAVVANCEFELPDNAAHHDAMGNCGNTEFGRTLKSA